MSVMVYVRHWYAQMMYVIGDELSYFAASLSFYTIFSVIPMFWVLFYVLSQFDAFFVYYKSIKLFIVSSLVPAHTEVVSQYLDKFLMNTNRMGVWGIFYILVASILFFRNYKYIVNKIFLMPDYSAWHSIRTYLILVLLMPLTLGASFYFTDVVQQLVGSKYSNMLHLVTLISFFVTWAIFFLLLKFSPTMDIGWRITLLVSFLVTLAWNLAKTAFVHYVVINHVYNSLYGSFSVIIFLLIWIYLSWFVVLHGLRLCYLLHCQSSG
jgi:membrane protein